MGVTIGVMMGLRGIGEKYQEGLLYYAAVFCSQMGCRSGVLFMGVNSL